MNPPMSLTHVTVDLQKLGGKFLYDATSGRYDIVGACLIAQGIPAHMLAGYVSPSDWAQGALIHQEIPDVKDYMIGFVNNRMLKPDSTFTNNKKTWALMLTYDAADEAGALFEPRVQEELRKLALELGFALEFTGEFHLDSGHANLYATTAGGNL